MTARSLCLAFVCALASCSTAQADTQVSTFNPWNPDGTLLATLQPNRLNDVLDYGCGGDDGTAEILAGHTQSTVAAGALKCLSPGMDSPSVGNAADPCWPNPAGTMVACTGWPGGQATVVAVSTLPPVDLTPHPHPWALQIGNLVCVTFQPTAAAKAPSRYDCRDFRTRNLPHRRWITTFSRLISAPDRSQPTWTVLRRKFRETHRPYKTRHRSRTSRVAVARAWY